MNMMPYLTNIYSYNQTEVKLIIRGADLPINLTIKAYKILMITINFNN